MKVGQRVQDTALPEGNRSGTRCRRGESLQVVPAAIVAARPFHLEGLASLTRCVKLRGFGGSVPKQRGVRGELPERAVDVHAMDMKKTINPSIAGRDDSACAQEF